MSFWIDDEKLLEKYKAIWTKIQNLENIKRFTSICMMTYIKTKIRTCGDEIYTNFRDLNVPEDDIL